MAWDGCREPGNNCYPGLLRALFFLDIKKKIETLFCSRTKDMYRGRICVDPGIWSYLRKIQGQASVSYLI